MLKCYIFAKLAFLPLMISANAAENLEIPKQPQQQQNKQQPSKALAKPFTGKIVGQNVRLRIQPDLESHVVKEFEKNELVEIDGEKNDFYAVKPPSGTKAYVFRSFILDNIVEGNRVNVRLFPDLDAPIIGHLTTGQHIDGLICEKNHKWLEIPPPKETRFYVAKEYIEFLGGPELKSAFDKRKSSVSQLMESAQLLSQSELRKPFEEINFEKLAKGYQTIINDYADFPEMVEKAKAGLSVLNETYLQKKLNYLENKTSKLDKRLATRENADFVQQEKEISNISMTDRMKIWEPIEEGIYLSWAAMHHAKTMDDYYKDQKLQAIPITGILETYPDPVKNKPGDFLLKDRDLPLGYIYSTHVDLDHLVGKQVKLFVAPRPNNNFAFPAYYVIGVEQ